ncbi:MAG TPA: hypothetical protein VKX25_00135 [Bryobacteraceae bacterium]|jgi:flagellar hook protein FlgE|nr:hypothetical protein [Bryobacteraceae bacterium]
MNIYSAGIQTIGQAQVQFERSAAAITRAGFPSSSDTVDLSTEAVSLLSAKNQFGAGLDLIKIGDEMQKSTLSLIA